MTTKRVPIHLRPGTEKLADEWVTGEPGTAPQAAPAPPPSSPEAEERPVAIKRLTIDVPEDLHRRLKVKAATEGVRMADLLRSWIEAGCA